MHKIKKIITLILIFILTGQLYLQAYVCLAPASAVESGSITDMIPLLQGGAPLKVF